MRIALFGGTFNPPHVGHVHVVGELTARFDQVWVVVANDPNKKEKPFISPEHRLNMAKLAFGGFRNVKVSAIELERGGVSYSIDTIDQLRKEHPEHEFWWVFGADLLAEFPRWKDSGRLAKTVPFLAVSRPGFVLDTERLRVFSEAEVFDDSCGINASSTEIRHSLSRNNLERVKALLPGKVFEYIEQNALYRPEK